MHNTRATPYPDPMTQPPSPPGWYPDPLRAGFQRWWDGNQWTPYQVAPTPAPIKSLGVAWVLALLLGGFGAHMYYLRRPWFATVMLVTTLAGMAATTWSANPQYTSTNTAAGGLMFVSVLLVVISLFLIGPDVRAINGAPVKPTELKTKPAKKVKLWP